MVLDTPPLLLRMPETIRPFKSFSVTLMKLMRWSNTQIDSRAKMFTSRQSCSMKNAAFVKMPNQLLSFTRMQMHARQKSSCYSRASRSRLHQTAGTATGSCHNLSTLRGSLCYQRRLPTHTKTMVAICLAGIQPNYSVCLLRATRSMKPPTKS